MDFDFTKSAPQPKSLRACHELIVQLWSHSGALSAKMMEQSQKLQSNSSNSSQPPSQDNIRTKAERRNKRADWRRRTSSYWSKPRQGAQPGHKGTGRGLVALSAVDEIIRCYPNQSCGYCAGSVIMGEIRQRKQVFDLPTGLLQVTEYQLIGGRCSECRKRCRGELPSGVPNGVLGANALAKISILTGRYRLSKREVAAFLAEFFSLRVSVGTISNAEKQVSDALKAPVDALGASVAHQNYLHADETSYPNQGALHWLWVATNKDFTYFQINQNRNQTAAKSLLGENYEGMLISDRYGAYNWLPGEQRQYCWAHLKRDFKKISELPNPSEAFIGHCLLANLKSIFYHWRTIQSGTAESYHKGFMRSAMKRLYQYLRRGSQLDDTKTGRFCKKLLRERHSLWHFIKNNEVDSTNNQAERQLRHAVIWRKQSYGTQSARGMAFVERILTTVMTCRQQGRDLIAFISDCIKKTIDKENTKLPAPSLLI